MYTLGFMKASIAQRGTNWLVLGCHSTSGRSFHNSRTDLLIRVRSRLGATCFIFSFYPFPRISLHFPGIFYSIFINCWEEESVISLERISHRFLYEIPQFWHELACFFHISLLCEEPHKSRIYKGLGRSNDTLSTSEIIVNIPFVLLRPSEQMRKIPRSSLVDNII
jgi:hypothetical protein